MSAAVAVLMLVVGLEFLVESLAMSHGGTLGIVGATVGNAVVIGGDGGAVVARFVLMVVMLTVVVVEVVVEIAWSAVASYLDVMLSVFVTACPVTV